jgi:hypothetical protein
VLLDLLDRDTLALVGVASGQTRLVARLAVHALVCGHDLDLQVSRAGPHYVAVVTELRGETIVSEVVLIIEFGRIEEGLRLGVLSLWVQGIVLDAARWRRRHESAVAVALAEAAVRFGSPDQG